MKFKKSLMLLDRVYINSGNLPLIHLISSNCNAVLDVGCGGGSNAALIKDKYPHCKVHGITISQAEADLAKLHLDRCWVFDIEDELPHELTTQSFDVLVFSHILEHLSNPAQVLANLSKLVVPGGVVLIAVPNILSWRERVRFVFGDFEYESSGALDDTHLRFFTYFTADRYLFAQTPHLQLIFKGVKGSLPLWILRRYILPGSWTEFIDTWGCQHWPNLFGSQILIKAVKN